MQSISEEKLTQGFSSLVNLVVPPLQFLMAALAGLLLYLLALYLFSLCLRRWLNKLKGPSLQSKILGFFFLLFCFFIKELYNDNLNTENISVDVSDLLYSEEQLLNTHRQPCFMDEVSQTYQIIY